MVNSRQARPSARRGGWRSDRLGAAVKIVAALALVSICLEHGFTAPPLPVPALLACQLLAVLLYAVHLAYRLVAAGNLRAALRRNVFDVALVVGAWLVILALFEFSRYSALRAAALSVVVVQVLLAVRFGIGVIRWNLEMSQRGLRPARLIVLSFLGAILAGGLLLSLPRAMQPEHRHEQGAYEGRRVLNCFFTAASATCVTGLVVYDTGQDFTRFGQGVILVLIQLGGLGIMIFGSLFGLLAGRQLSLRQSLVLQDALSHQTIGRLREMVRFIVGVTLACECLGALLLYSMWDDQLVDGGERLFYSVFHSVSAFCNAGFALQGDSLVSYRGSWGVYAAIMPLIVLGGLGFPVLSDLWAWARSRLPGPGVVWRAVGRGGGRAGGPPRPRHCFSLHTKTVLWATGLLIVLPALGLLLCESTPPWRSRGQVEAARLRARAEGRVSVMADLPLGERAAAALFQSVTTRTAGFNTVHLDPDSLSPASRFLMALLMFIGGAPASTAGGVKTVAVAVLLLSIYGTLRGRPNVEGFGRTVPQVVLRRAAVVVVMMFLVVGLLTLLLCYTEATPLPRVLFEAVSACGTVGLSAGLTDELTIAGRVLIILAMFVGRIGPLTVLVALAGRTRALRYDYPEEHLIIG